MSDLAVQLSPLRSQPRVRRWRPPDDWQKEPHSKIYPLPGGRSLLVPTEDLWIVHEASKPTAILKRAELRPGCWGKWQLKYGRSMPWVFEWLYNNDADLPGAAMGKLTPTTGRPPDSMRARRAACEATSWVLT